MGVAVLNSISAKCQLEVGELGDFLQTSSYETIGYYGIFEFPAKFPVPIANLIFILPWQLFEKIKPKGEVEFNEDEGKCCKNDKLQVFSKFI